MFLFDGTIERRLALKELFAKHTIRYRKIEDIEI